MATKDEVPRPEVKEWPYSEVCFRIGGEDRKHHDGVGWEMMGLEAVGVEEYAEEGASRKPKPTLEVREEYNVFPGLGFRLNLAFRKTALDFWRNPVSPVQPVQVPLFGLGSIPAPPDTFFTHVVEVCRCIRATLQAQRRLVGIRLPGAKIPDRKLLSTTGFLANEIYRVLENQNKKEENRLALDSGEAQCE